MLRLSDPASIGPQFHTPSQAELRQSLGNGRDGAQSFDADPARRDPETGTAPARANACRLTRHDARSATIVRLEATGNGWVDMGGGTGRTVKATNPRKVDW